MSTFYLGGDVSKGYCDFIMLNQEKKTVIEPFQPYDSAKGHFQFESTLLDFAANHPDCKIIAGVESTGGYENNWFETLYHMQDKIDVEVTRINPIATHHSSKASLDRVVNDKVSARTIAEYLINYRDKLNFRKPDRFSSLRRQWKLVKMLGKHRTQLYNQLEGNLYIANPELLRYAKHGYPGWLMRVLIKYPTAVELANARVSSLSEIPYVSEERARKLVEAAKTSVASSTDKAIGATIRYAVKSIIRLTKDINKHSGDIAENAQLEELEILKTFPGIGDYTAIGLLLYIGDVANYACTKKLSSFSGIHPVWKQSGDGSFGMHISKKGNKEIRSLLYNVAFTAIRCNPLIKEIYHRQVSKGKNGTSAIVVCMHKILRIIYGMLKNREKFNPEKDRANSTKAVRKAALKIKYQPIDPAAPISARQYRKRKQQEMSQDVITTSNTGSIAHCSQESLPEKK